MPTPPKKTKDTQYSKLNQAEQGVVATPVSTPVAKATPIKTKARVTASGERPPPFGLPEGGTWGTNTHHGSQTCCTSAGCCICCGGIAACVVCCFPFDKRRAYMIENKVYDENGSYIGTGCAHFRDEEFDGNVDEKQKFNALIFAGVVGFICTVLYLSIQMSAGPGNY